MDSLASVWIQTAKYFSKHFLILNQAKVYNVNFYNDSLSIKAENFHGGRERTNTLEREDNKSKNFSCMEKSSVAVQLPSLILGHPFLIPYAYEPHIGKGSKKTIPTPGCLPATTTPRGPG